MSLQIMQIDKSIKDKIAEPIPESLIKERNGGGGKMLSYISGATVTDMLNNIFGYCWSWVEKEQWITESIPYFNTYSKAPDNMKITGPNGKKGAWEDQSPVAHVRGDLTVYLKDENGNVVPITKSGYGSKSIMGKQSDQEHIFKAAGTDALKKAASLLGIGLELYRGEEEAEYFNDINYEDPWTDEAKIKCKEQLQYLREYMETNEVSQEEFDDFVYNLLEEQLTPDNIDEVVNYIQKELEEE